MAQSVLFDSKVIKIPGPYSQIKFNLKNPPLNLSFGGVLIIDNGKEPNYGFGAGTDGTLSKNKQSIYKFDSIDDFKDAVGGGLYHYLSNALFFPAGRGAGINGISNIEYIRPATTAPAEIALVFTGGGLNGGTFTAQCKVEGVPGNGLENGSLLTKGFAATVEAGVKDTAKVVIKFWRGGYKGINTYLNKGAVNEPYDGVKDTDSIPVLLCKTPEFSNLQEALDWAQQDVAFNFWFKLKASSAVAGTGAVTAADVTALAGNNLAAGGTETFSTQLLTNALKLVATSQTSFVLCDEKEPDTAANLQIIQYATNDAKYKKSVYVASGDVEGDFASSITKAAAADSDHVSVVHGGCKKKKFNGGFYEYNSIVKAAYFLGREAGIDPQNPLTNKHIDIDGELHPLTESQKEDAMDGGLLVSHYDEDFEKFVCLRGINSVQDNDFLVNASKKSYSKQLNRIVDQINKELVINAKKSLFAKESGLNRKTLSEADIEAWTEGYLQSKIASSESDNLLLGFQNIVVSVEGTAFKINYELIPNFEIDFLLFTGVVIDPTQN